VLVESGRGGRPGEEPPASEVVRARLLQLIRELQQARPPEPVPLVGARYVESQPDPPAAGGPGDGGEDGDADDWLDRLRHPVDPDPGPEPAAEPAAPVLRRSVGQVLAFGREHLAAVVVVLLVGIAWSAYSLLQARSTPVAAAAPVIQSSASATPQPGSASSAPAQVVVHVIGAVRRPGVVKLPDGSRVADAITAAGGLSPNAAPGELNLAQVLADGVQVKVGTRSHPGGWIRGAAGTATPASGGSSGGDPTKVALNSATLEQLDTLPGIGPVTAQKILDWRKAHGKFTAITELQEVDGIGPKTYADLADHIRL
jgi:competence protein ComEA